MNSFYFPHDNNARNDQKILMLRLNFGIEGYGVFFMILETMYSDSTGYINRGAIGGLSIPFGIEFNKLQLIVDYCVEVGLIKICEHKNYFNDRVLEQKKLQQSFVEYGRIGGKTKWKNNKNQPVTTPPTTPPIYPPTTINKINKIIKEKKEVKHSFENSPYFDKKVFRAALPDWSVDECRIYYDKALGYSQANGGKYLNWIMAIKNWYREDCLKKTKPPEKRGLVV